MIEKRFDRSFFERPTLIVAQELIGKHIIFQNFQGIITETEAYCGLNDPASHAYRGITPRTAVMFGPAAHSYVYFIYGMYYCLNFVTEQEGTAGAVLIRGLKLIEGDHLNGPGKLCKRLGITKEHNQIDLTTHPSFYVTDSGLNPDYQATPRIGIKQATDKLWRFVVKN